MATIREYIDVGALRQPRKVFLTSPETGAELTWSQLQVLSQSIAVRLEGLGLAKGDKVAFLLSSGYWSAALFLGVMYSGRVIAAINARAGALQLAYVLEHSDSKVLFISRAYQAEFREVLDSLSSNTRIILTDEDTGPEWPASTDRPSGLPALDESNDAILIYTSGTTGRPKGVVLTHKNVIAGGKNVSGAHDLASTDCGLCVLPLYHINAQIVTVIGPLVSNGHVVMPHRFSASTFWDLVERYKCTWVSLVPTIIAILLEQARQGQSRYNKNQVTKHLRFVRSASAPLPIEHLRAFEEYFGAPIVDTMGLTETTGPILANPMPSVTRMFGSPGRTYGNEARIVDLLGTSLPAFQTGELLIRGDNVMKGYYKNPEATREALDADGWLHTGDLAYCDENGFYFITGRIKELIIKGGENIAPREIDDILYQHPAVREAAAFGISDVTYGQNVMAAVALKSGHSCTEQELIEYCTARLGRYKAPVRITFLDDLPKGPSEKILRTKLSSQYADLAQAMPLSKVPGETSGLTAALASATEH